MNRPALPRLRFTKMHGAGNDFVVLDLRDGSPPPDAGLAARIADRHRGVGCDQILTIEPPRDAGSVASYRIWNSDGSTSQQCGNGARCVAAWLVRDGAAQGDAFMIDSPLRTHAVQRLGDGHYAVAMGLPEFEPARIPLIGFPRAREEYVVPLQGENVRFGAVSMGNPHAVLEVGLIDAAPVERMGPRMPRSCLRGDHHQAQADFQFAVAHTGAQYQQGKPVAAPPAGDAVAFERIQQRVRHAAAGRRVTLDAARRRAQHTDQQAQRGVLAVPIAVPEDFQFLVQVAAASVAVAVIDADHRGEPPGCLAHPQRVLLERAAVLRSLFARERLRQQRLEGTGRGVHALLETGHAGSFLRIKPSPPAAPAG